VLLDGIKMVKKTAEDEDAETDEFTRPAITAPAIGATHNSHDLT